MEIASEFSVAAAPAEVYAALLDLERVGPCIPGASVGPAGPDGAHPAEIAVRLGPMRLTYRGTVRVVDHAEAARTATLEADVREVRGQGNAHARMTMSVTDQATGAHVQATTAVELSGRAAQMGAGIVEDVAGRLVADMATRLEALLTPSASGGHGSPPAGPPSGGGERPPAPAPPIGGLRLLLRALWHRLRHGRPQAGAPDTSSP
jgi:carbon monoxide dehydrogenase subunit G